MAEMSGITDVNERDARRNALVLSAITLFVVTVPIVQNFRADPDDGFPFSYYPMFTARRGEDTGLIHPVGVRADGSEVDLHYRFADDGGMNQVRRQIRKRVRNGQADLLCEEIARNVAASRDPAVSDVVEVQLVDDDYHIRNFFAGQQEPHRRKVLVRCLVERKKSKP